MLTDDDAALIDEVDGLVRGWLAHAQTTARDRSAERLATVIEDPDGLRFTVDFVDRVIRPEDVGEASRSLRRLARSVPRFLPWHLRVALRLGALAALIAPRLVIPVVRAALRRMVGHLVLDAGEGELGSAIARIRADGMDLNLNLLGESVLGQHEASARLEGVWRLLERPDVDYVSVKVSAVVAPHNPWAFDQAVTDIIESLLPLYRYAMSQADHGVRKFINLDMEEFHDLDLTVAVFTGLLERPELRDLEAGIVLQAYLPDAYDAMVGLQAWAARRRAHHGAGIKVRLVKGANLPMERVESSLRGWPLATWATKQETDTHYKRILRYSLTPSRLANVRLGVAGHNLFDVAYAWTLAGHRGCREGVEFEMLLGMAPGEAAAVRKTVGGLRLYVPVVRRDEFDVAIAYLVRRLEEGASQENFMSAVYAMRDREHLFQRERTRFVASLAEVESGFPATHRGQNREVDAVADTGRTTFSNVADTDPSTPGNRAWAAGIVSRIGGSTLGDQLVREHTITDAASLDAEVESAHVAGVRWGARSGAERAEVLRRAAAVLENRRADLLEVMASECGKTLDQGDPEVSEAIDFADYYASLAEDLDDVDGARHVPVRLTVVTPPWNFPVAIPAGSTLAALAAGSAVVLKPAGQARRCGSVLAAALWEAGVPREVLRLVHLDEADLGSRLVADPRVERLILTGAYETAELFRSLRPDLPLLAETSGKNAIVITPAADLDLAVRDLVTSAFGHAGQKCSAASLAILVGGVAESRRFRRQLIDAASSLVVDAPTNPGARMGPLIGPAEGKLLEALTVLGPGEEWWVEPRLLHGDRLWSPGVKAGVRRGSAFHLTEYFGPVLGLIAARDLDEAVQIQNEVAYGLTAGLHSLDPDEIRTWTSQVQAGNLYVNRTTVGAVVQRQPFGGWKRSSVGAGTKAGGPNYLIGLSDWAPSSASLRTPALPGVATLLDAARAAGIDDLEFLVRGAASDALAWAEEFGVARDASGLEAERNWLRYVPVPVTIRYEGGRPIELMRVLAAGLAAGADLTVSTARPLGNALAGVVGTCGAELRTEDADAWSAMLCGPDAPARVRLVGGDRHAFAAASGGRPDVALHAGAVLEAGRIEMLTFLREQAVSMTAHRFGTPLAPAAFPLP